MKYFELDETHHEFFEAMCNKTMEIFGLSSKMFLTVVAGGQPQDCDAYGLYSLEDSCLNVFLRKNKIPAYYNNVYKTLTMISFHEVFESGVLGQMSIY